MAGLLSPDSSFYRALNSATDLVILNALTILGCVPVVTAGASLTACARVTADMVREEDEYIVRSWWASFKGNLRQSFGWWLPVLALLVLAVAENWLIGGIRGATLAGALTGLIALGTAIVVGILSWLCPLVAQFDNTVAGHVSSACILAGAHRGEPGGGSRPPRVLPPRSGRTRGGRLVRGVDRLELHGLRARAHRERALRPAALRAGSVRRVRRACPAQSMRMALAWVGLPRAACWKPTHRKKHASRPEAHSPAGGGIRLPDARVLRRPRSFRIDSL